MTAQESRKKAEEKYKKFSDLYTKFVAGKKWLDSRAQAGASVVKDTDDFTAHVIAPLHAMWQGFNEAERKALESVTKLCDEFGCHKLDFTSKSIPTR